MSLALLQLWNAVREAHAEHWPFCWIDSHTEANV